MLIAANDAKSDSRKWIDYFEQIIDMLRDMFR